MSTHRESKRRSTKIRRSTRSAPARSRSIVSSGEGGESENKVRSEGEKPSRAFDSRGSARNSARSGSQRGIFTGSHRRVVRRRRHTEPNPPGRSSSRGSERRRMQSSTNANRTSSEERTPLRTGTNKSSSTETKSSREQLRKNALDRRISEERETAVTSSAEVQGERQEVWSDSPPSYPDSLDEKDDEEKRKPGCDGRNRSTKNFFNKDFNEIKIRQKFVQKVYLTLTWQLILTAGIVCCFIFIRPLQKFCTKNWWITLCFMAGFLIFYLILMCSKKCRRRFPGNLILLIFFTLIFGCFLGAATCWADTWIILIALGVTVVVVVCVSLFACQTRFDFTSWIGVLFVIGIVFCLFGILLIFFHNRILMIVYSCLGALLFTVYLAVDTQLVIGGKRYELHREDWVQGAIILYMDICYIFMFIVMAGGSIKG